MKTHVRYHPLKYGGLTRCAMPVSSIQRDGRWVIRCISTRRKGSLFCDDHDRRLDPSAPKTFANRLLAWVTPLGLWPRPFDHRCSCSRPRLVWMCEAEPHPRCVIHGVRSR